MLNREAIRYGLVEIEQINAPSATMVTEDQLEKERLERKVRKLKGKVESSRQAIALLESRVAVLTAEKEDLTERVKNMQAWRDEEVEEKYKYWRALTESQKEVQRLQEEIEPGGWSGGAQGPEYCSPLP